MEEVLVTRTLMGLTAVRELSNGLSATVETQRALADKVGPRLHFCFVLLFRLSFSFTVHISSLRWRP